MQVTLEHFYIDSHGNRCVHQGKIIKMMTPSGLNDVTKQRMLQAKALSMEARGRKFESVDLILFLLLSKSTLKQPSNINLHTY